MHAANGRSQEETIVIWVVAGTLPTANTTVRIVSLMVKAILYSDP
jgi:hypothetical protein